MALRSVYWSAIAAGVLLCGAMAHGQREVVSVPRVPLTPDGDHSWTTLYPLLAAHKVQIVTVARPRKRQNCRVASIAADQIACSRHFGGSVLYRRQDVVALIEPATHDPTGPVVLATMGTGTGIIVAAVLSGITLGAAIPLEILGSMLILSCGAMEIGDNYEPTPAHLLYLAPGAQLQFKLK